MELKVTIFIGCADSEATNLSRKLQPAPKHIPPPVREDTHGVLRVADSRVALDPLVEL